MRIELMIIVGVSVLLNIKILSVNLNKSCEY